MSNDTQVKQEAPERVWIWTVEPYQWHDTKTAELDIEYVRADLLATVRREEREAARDRTVKTLIGLRENFIPVNRALEIVVNAAALTANDAE